MLTPDDVSRLNAALSQIRKLDQTLTDMAGQVERNDGVFEELGGKVKSTLGTRVVDVRVALVGQIAWVALFNHILDAREELRQTLDGEVDMDPSHYKRQEVSDEV